MGAGTGMGMANDTRGFTCAVPYQVVLVVLVPAGRHYEPCRKVCIALWEGGLGWKEQRGWGILRINIHRTICSCIPMLNRAGIYHFRHSFQM